MFFQDLFTDNTEMPKKSVADSAIMTSESGGCLCMHHYLMYFFGYKHFQFLSNVYSIAVQDWLYPIMLLLLILFLVSVVFNFVIFETTFIISFIEGLHTLNGLSFIKMNYKLIINIQSC